MHTVNYEKECQVGVGMWHFKMAASHFMYHTFNRHIIVVKWILEKRENGICSGITFSSPLL
ncbi:hypothetical protein V1478_011589 [Vespula squamosa]|uniref:Uncharacterized protein n=1 Tax=Vespula squamosa TaxID=30214 RepID=A0ABD2AH36_VESSQ